MNCPYCGAPELAETNQDDKSWQKKANAGWVDVNIIRVNSWDETNSLQELYRCIKCNHRWNVPIDAEDNPCD